MVGSKLFLGEAFSLGDRQRDDREVAAADGDFGNGRIHTL
jgi:hypothetical protein